MAFINKYITYMYNCNDIISYLTCTYVYIYKFIYLLTLIRRILHSSMLE